MTDIQPLTTSKAGFQEIREKNYLYVDKTEQIYHFAQYDEKFFFHRPRRFGKSLTISTLDALFRGKKELFKGLWIEKKWEWKPRPVVRFNFSQISSNNSIEDFREDLNLMILENADKNQISFPHSNRWKVNFHHLLSQIGKKGQWAMLIDEYDHPLYAAMDNPELDSAIRDELNLFYLEVKARTESHAFVFITGITKFSKTSLFSGINDTEDISLDAETATLCGITQEELEVYFKPYIKELGSSIELNLVNTMTELKNMYNGYRFSSLDSTPTVYNPYSLINCFRKKKLKYYWFDSGTPSLVGKLFEKQNYDLSLINEPQLFENELTKNAVSFSDIDLVPLLYQTGYLTIAKIEDFKIHKQSTRSDKFFLRFPNEEVEHAFFGCLAEHLTPHGDVTARESLAFQMKEDLINHNLDGFISKWQSTFSAIPYVLNVPQEKYYHTLLFVFAHLGGLNVKSELMTSDGRIDLVIELEDKIYLFEFKMEKSSQKAIHQIERKKYYQSFLTKNKPIVIVGVSFSKKNRTIEKWQSKTILPLR